MFPSTSSRETLRFTLYWQMACNSGQHFAGNSEMFLVWRHSFRNVARSWHLAGNSFIALEHDARLVNFIKSHISDATVFHMPPISTQQVIEDLKSIPNNNATGLYGIAGFHMTSRKFKLQNYWSCWYFTFMSYKSSWKLIVRRIFVPNGLLVLR